MKKNFTSLTGANRRRIDQIFRDLGGRISPVRRHGELVYEHPQFSRPIKVNARRKDTTCQIAKLVLRLAKSAA